MDTRRFGVTLLVGLLVLQPSGSSAWDIEWTNQFGTAAFEFGTGVATDSSGVYVAGTTAGGTLPGQSAAGGQDAYLRKFDHSGAVLWTRQFGTPLLDQANPVATDATGVYVAGRTRGTLPGQVTAGGIDAFVRKYSPSGDVLWTSQFGTAATEALAGIASHATGVYVAGYTTGTFPGEPGGSGVDVFVAKLDPETGGLLWVRQFGVRGQSIPATERVIGGVDVDDTGVYVAGLVSPGLASLLRRYDFDGSLLWEREISSSNGCLAALFAVAVHSTGVYAVGQTAPGFFGGPGCEGANNSEVGFVSVVGFLRKYDINGDVLWTRKIQGVPKEEHGVQLLTGAKRVRASDAGVFVSANVVPSFAGQLPVGSPSDRAECPAFDPDFFDQLDAYVRMYDFEGNVIWTHQFGSSLFDIASDMAIVGDTLYASGDTGCRIDPSQTFLGGQDAYLLRMTVNPTSLPGQVQLIVGRLETLNDAEVLVSGDFDSLVKHLEAALAGLDRGRNDVAKRNLEAFITEVGTLEVRGELSSSEASALVAAATAVIAQL